MPVLKAFIVSVAQHSSRLYVAAAIFALLIFAAAAGEHMRERRSVYGVGRMSGVVAFLLRIALVHWVVVSLRFRFSDIFLVALLGVIIVVAFADVECLTNGSATIFCYLLLVIPEVYIPKALQLVSAVEYPRRHVFVILAGGAAQVSAAIIALQTMRGRHIRPLTLLGACVFIVACVIRTFGQAMAVVKAEEVEMPDATAEERQELTQEAVVVEGDGEQPPHPPPEKEKEEGEKNGVLVALSRLRAKREMLEAKLGEYSPKIVSAFALIRRAPIWAIIVALFAASLCMLVAQYSPQRGSRLVQRPTLPPRAQPPQYNNNINSPVFSTPSSMNQRRRINRNSDIVQEEQFNKRDAKEMMSVRRLPYNNNNDDDETTEWRPNRRVTRAPPGGLDPAWQLPTNYVSRGGCGRRTRYEYSLKYRGSTRYWEHTIVVHGWYRASKGACTAFLLFAAELLFVAAGSFGLSRVKRLVALAACFAIIVPPPFFATEAAIAVLVAVPWLMWADHSEASAARTAVSNGETEERNSDEQRAAEVGIDRERAAWELVVVALAVAFAMRHIRTPSRGGTESVAPPDLVFVVALLAHVLVSMCLYRSMFVSPK